MHLFVLQQQAMLARADRANTEWQKQWLLGGALTLFKPFYYIVAAVVLAGGDYFHYSQLPRSLAAAPQRAAKFDFEWQDSGKLGLILGHHLIFLGLGALLLVTKAQFFGGLYDAYSESVRESPLQPSIRLLFGTTERIYSMSAAWKIWWVDISMWPVC